MYCSRWRAASHVSVHSLQEIKKKKKKKEDAPLRGMKKKKKIQ